MLVNHLLSLKKIGINNLFFIDVTRVKLRLFIFYNFITRFIKIYKIKIQIFFHILQYS